MARDWGLVYKSVFSHVESNSNNRSDDLLHYPLSELHEARQKFDG